MRDIRVAVITSFVTLLFLAGVSAYLAYVHTDTRGMLEVSFLDVGQGDATYIESPSGMQVLVDGGRDASVLRGLQKEMGFFDRTLDVVVATHPDADHIGGLIDVFKRYKVAIILLTENVNDTPVRDVFMRALEAEGSEVVYVRAGQEYMLGAGAAGSTTLRILFPDTDPTAMESNTSSIIAQVDYGAVEYLLTGDSPKAIEEYLVGKMGAALQSEVLKVGHHGSRTSSAETFLTTVAPTYAIISAGKDNSYGHPHKEVTELLSRQGITMYNTAEAGNIESVSDGVTVWFE